MEVPDVDYLDSMYVKYMDNTHKHVEETWVHDSRRSRFWAAWFENEN